MVVVAVNAGSSKPFESKWSSKYRGATVEDLDPPAALSLNPSDAISLALLSAFERDYTHLTIVDSQTRALLGYISIPNLQSLLDSGKVITMETPLEELEAFFRGGVTEGEWTQDFAVITDDNRRFVMGVATVQDLEEFAKRRPE
ncbi:unnamed protein product [Clonostachys rosea f. rosea IK726]|uniref:CBS domain-containing protein n=2 Tax=Bionectria ochroleuca TaxID=29856 RepID=A0A0B7JKS1_BIOOC|nr:unnamed protein product [Clonostachys rosea f. rosea IK726]